MSTTPGPRPLRSRKPCSAGQSGPRRSRVRPNRQRPESHSGPTDDGQHPRPADSLIRSGVSSGDDRLHDVDRRKSATAESRQCNTGTRTKSTITVVSADMTKPKNEQPQHGVETPPRRSMRSPRLCQPDQVLAIIRVERPRRSRRHGWDLSRSCARPSSSSARRYPFTWPTLAGMCALTCFWLRDSRRLPAVRIETATPLAPVHSPQIRNRRSARRPALSGGRA
jgi:hypothetical protein